MVASPTLRRLEVAWTDARNRLDDLWHHGHPIDEQWQADVRGLEQVLEQTGDEILAVAKDVQPMNRR